MKTKIILLTLFMVLTGLNSALAQRGIGTLEPKTTLHVEGVPATTTTPDGVKAPVLTLAQLEAKLAAYGADQDGAFVYVDDVTTGSTTAETCKIISNGYYYYNSANDVWEAFGSKRYCVGDFAQGGVVFWVDETGEHGLVVAIEDQSTGTSWHRGTDARLRALGDGIYSGKLNTSLIIGGVLATGDDGGDYAAQLCNDLQVTIDGITYGDWYLPSNEELLLLAANRTIINPVATANGGQNFSGNIYWTSTEGPSFAGLDYGAAFAGRLNNDLGNGWFNKVQNDLSVRAIRSF